MRTRRNTNGKDVYGSGSFRWLKGTGDGLARDGAILVSAVHLGKIENNPHWASVVVDFSSTETPVRILYGDSFKQPIPFALEDALKWWVSQHTSRAAETGELAVGKQQDGFSCGMLAMNSLEYFVDSRIALSEPGG
ncbi:hypothetical protein C8F01DRAFT_1001606 [Mycena amicta]|nr:hypothetical protein C8F01DRAFT_1001606 [Mycena amicta]